MGKKIEEFFNLAKAEGGSVLQMRLSMKTGVSTVKAKELPDTSENIEKFQAAFKELTGKDAPLR